MNLSGKTVLITGASAGIGAATARALAAAGSRVLLAARTESALASLADEIGRARGKASAYPVDVSDADAVGRMAQTVAADVGTPDVIINNAGAGRFLFITETTPQEAVEQMTVPYFAAFFVTRAFIEAMLARGSGTIVNVNTPASRMPWPGACGYSAARWALRGFTEALRVDLAGSGIKVCEVVPAKVASEYFARHPGAESRIPTISKLIPTLTPEQVGTEIVRGLERDAREINTPSAYRLIAAQAKALPRFNSWLLVKTGAKRPTAP